MIFLAIFSNDEEGVLRLEKNSSLVHVTFLLGQKVPANTARIAISPNVMVHMLFVSTFSSTRYSKSPCMSHA